MTMKFAASVIEAPIGVSKSSGIGEDEGSDSAQAGTS